MPPLVNNLLVACAVLSAVFSFLDFLRVRSLLRFLLEEGLLVATAVALHAATGFPEPVIRQSFGPGVNLLPMVGLLFVCIALGMAARYILFLRGPFSWMSFVRPLCVSPIVLLPLLGTLQSDVSLDSLQVISFSLLAFQNGFFWRVIFERAKTKLAR
jgi:hypothetical protein